MTSKINATVTELSAKLAEKISYVDGKLVIDQDAYVTTLPEDISVEMVRKVHEHNSNFFPAVTLAVGDVSTPILKKDKKLDSLHLEVPMLDKDHFDVTMQRSRTFPNPQGGEAVKTWGYVSASLTTQSARASRGVMTHVRDHLTAEAMKAFGN